MTILIVEGPDGSGKSTLIEQASARLNWPADFVMKLPRADMKAYWRRHPEEATAKAVIDHVCAEMAKHCAKHSPLAVFDRGWPSNFVYQENPISFDELPEFCRVTPTLIYLVLPPLDVLKVRKAKRDGVGVGSGLADHLSTDLIHERYTQLRPEAENHIVVWDDQPSVDRFVESVTRCL